MPTAQLFLVQDNSSDAAFRSWGSAIAAQMDAAGWTRTADTGQVNWTTVTAPASGAYVYEIRQPASDPLQTGATAYYLRLEYGTKATTFPHLRISMGTGTNGAGVLTGFVTAVLNMMFPGTATVVPNITWECDFSWDVSRFAMLLWRNTTVATAVASFGVERIKAGNGTDSTDGVTLFASGNGSSTTTQQTICFGVGATAMQGTWMGIRPTVATNVSDAFGGGIPVSPVWPDYGKFGNPHTIFATAALFDTSEGALVSSVIYGTSHVYLTTRNLNPYAGGAGVLMRFD